MLLWKVICGCPRFDSYPCSSVRVLETYTTDTNAMKDALVPVLSMFSLVDYHLRIIYTCFESAWMGLLLGRGWSCKRRQQQGKHHPKEQREPKRPQHRGCAESK